MSKLMPISVTVNGTVYEREVEAPPFTQRLPPP